MNEEMESELNKMDSRPENLAVSEDADVDEAIPIDLLKITKHRSIQIENGKRC